MNFISEIDKAYIAGIVDGEGSICISKTKPGLQKDGHRYHNPRYTLRIGIEMTEKNIISYLADIFKKPYQSRDRGMNRQVLYNVAWSAEPAKTFLDTILPFLKGKRAQAHLALFFWNNIQHVRGKGLVPKKELEFREQCYQKMKELNATGLQKRSTTTRVSPNNNLSHERPAPSMKDEDIV
jgi:hypothetical protein